MTRILPHDHEHRFATRSVHAGQILEPLAGAVMTPIYQTSTYVQPALGQHKGYEYARTQNPTREALERNVAALEGGTHGFAFGSGLAALDTILKLLRPRRPRRLRRERLRRHPSTDGADLRRSSGSRSPSWTCATSDNVERALTPATRVVYCETPTNPMMHLVDLAAVGDLTQARGLALRRGQHLRHAVLPAAARVRGGHRAPLDHQVPERPQRHGRRAAGDVARRPRRADRRSSRTPPAACPGRWTAGSPSAGSRRCRCACGSTTPTAAASPSGSPGGATWSSSTIPACPRTRSTSWPAVRCPASAA